MKKTRYHHLCIHFWQTKIEKQHGSPIFKTRNFQLNIGEIRMYNPDGIIG